MPFQILPARRTGGQDFAEAFSPYLQQAFQKMMQRKLEEEQFKKNIDLAKQMGFVSETQPALQDYQQQITGQGGAMNVDPNLPASEQFAAAQKLFGGAKIKPPSSQYALQQQPGMKTSMKFEGGVPTFGVETERQGLSSVPEGFEITGYDKAGNPIIKKEKIEKTDEVKEFEKSLKLKVTRGEQLTPEEVDYYNKFLWETGEQLKAPKIDKFGYYVGQPLRGYKYIGNNKWEEQ